MGKSLEQTTCIGLCTVDCFAQINSKWSTLLYLIRSINIILHARSGCLTKKITSSLYTWDMGKLWMRNNMHNQNVPLWEFVKVDPHVVMFDLAFPIHIPSSTTHTRGALSEVLKAFPLLGMIPKICRTSHNLRKNAKSSSISSPANGIKSHLCSLYWR